MGWIVQVVDWLNVCENFGHFDVNQTFKHFFSSSLIYVNTKLFLLIAGGLLNGFALFLFYFF